MSIPSRIARQFLRQQAAHRVARRFVWAMSRDDAKRTLGIPTSQLPSEAEVLQRYRERVRKTMRDTPDAIKQQDEFKDLNIAKDTLLGQFDRKEPGKGPNAPEAPAESQRRGPGDFRPEDEVKKKAPPEPAPVADGEPFAAALSGLGHADWKIMTDGESTYEVVVEQEGEGRDRKTYLAYHSDYIFIGRTNSHYVFTRLRRRINRRTIYDSPGEVPRWSTDKIVRPLDIDLLKVAPKIIKAWREKAHRRPKFMVIEGTLTETKVEKFRGSLSLLDAIAGSGILDGAGNAPVEDSRLKGRKLQVEIEPVYNPDKNKALKARGSRDWHFGYDWFVYVNGKKHELDEHEIEGLAKNYLLISVFSYDYTKGKVNLTRLRGTRMKMGPKDSLAALAKSLKPGNLKDTIQAAADSYPEG